LWKTQGDFGLEILALGLTSADLFYVIFDYCCFFIYHSKIIFSFSDHFINTEGVFAKNTDLAFKGFSGNLI